MYGSLLLPKPLVWHYTARGYRPLVRLGIFIEHQAALPAYSHYILPLQHGLHTPRTNQKCCQGLM